MIDRSTGSLHFDDGIVIGPALTRTQFLNMQVGETREVSVKNEPWCSWRVTRLKAGGRMFIAILQFQSEQLQSVELVESDQVGFGDWKDWSEAHELENLQRYEEFLTRELGSNRSFTWGSAKASYDARSGGSSISIAYRGTAPTSLRPDLVVFALLLLTGALALALAARR